MSTKKEVSLEQFKFGKDGLIPVVVQDFESGEVLMLVYMNEEAAKKTFETGFAHYYSRSRKSVTKYGENVGNTQRVRAAFLDHDNDTLLLKVRQYGNADAENNTFTCFPAQIQGEYNEIGAEMLGRLHRVIRRSRQNPVEGDYTSFLFARGIDRIAKKVGEEAVELVVASKNEEKAGVVNEAADLLYHLMVLLNEKEVRLSDVCAELCKRNR